MRCLWGIIVWTRDQWMEVVGLKEELALTVRDALETLTLSR